MTSREQGEDRMSEPAEIRVTNVRRVFNNGEHDAFTSLIRFRDRYYLSFRSCPDGHYAYPTSSLMRPQPEPVMIG